MSWMKRVAVIAGICLVAVVFLFNVFNVDLWAQTDAPGHVCRQRQSIAHGTSPHGIPWTAAVGVEKNGHACSAWLLRFEYRPDRKPYIRPGEEEFPKKLPMPGSFSLARAIPYGGHLSPGFKIQAQDEYEGAELVFAGLAGGSIGRVRVTLTNGVQSTIHARLPSSALRKRFVWLENLRYFVFYHRRMIHVRKVEVPDANRWITVKGSLGGFESGD